MQIIYRIQDINEIIKYLIGWMKWKINFQEKGMGKKAFFNDLLLLLQSSELYSILFANK